MSGIGYAADGRCLLTTMAYFGHKVLPSALLWRRPGSGRSAIAQDKTITSDQTQLVNRLA
jgi:hypothetical protein